MSGRSISLSAERHCRQLSQTIEAIRLLKLQITDRLEPVAEALMQTEFPPFQLVSSQMRDNFSAIQAWNEISSKGKGHAVDCLNESEKKQIGYMFNRLGAGGLTEQEELISTCCIHLERALSDAQARAKEVCKLYTSLGFLTGLFIAILIV